MTSFVSIIKWNGGVVSYRIVESGFDFYTAYLVKKTATAELPEEITIQNFRSYSANTPSADPLVDKLVAAIKVAELDGDAPV